ncbi:hypothetical protein [Undibacterium sp. GrIS 1.2]|uniref:hypothetical protein n=1 Tax=Undibacterium sp. GrIS 1.2 TaxID=3143933 RepID=UPI003390E8A9
MKIFGGDSELKIAALEDRAEKLDQARKKAFADLAETRKQLACATSEVEGLKIEVKKLKATLVKARSRQQSSVERANRFKARSVIV